MNSSCSVGRRRAVNVSSNWSTNTSTAARSPSRPLVRGGGPAPRRGGRPGSMATVRHGSAAGEDPGGQRRQQAGPHQRRLPAAGGPDHRQQRGLGQAGDQLGDQPLATEEVGGVGRLEPGQALVGAAGERRRPRSPGAAPRGPRAGRGAARAAARCPRRRRRSRPARRASRPRAPATRSAGVRDPAARPVPGPLAGLLVDQERERRRSARRAGSTSSAVQPSGS